MGALNCDFGQYLLELVQGFLRRRNDGKGLEYEIVRFCEYVRKYHAVKAEYGLSFEANDSATFEQCGVSIG